MTENASTSPELPAEEPLAEGAAELPAAPVDRDPPEDEEPLLDWVGEIRGLLLMLFAVLAFHSLVAKPFYIPSISMMPNLLVGDRLVVSKFPYGWNWASASFHILPRSTTRVMPATPQYGDIVIVVPRDRNDDLIKRVVALPGDRIAMQNGQIILNGKPVPQSVEPPVQLAEDPKLDCADSPPTNYCYRDFLRYRVRQPSGRVVIEPPTMREVLPNGATYLIIKGEPKLPENQDWEIDNWPEITVPAGHVFLLGDNRDHSADSRVPEYRQGLGGPVPLSDVGGRAEFITFSLNGNQDRNPLSLWRALRPGRAWTSLRPVRIVKDK